MCVWLIKQIERLLQVVSPEANRVNRRVLICMPLLYCLVGQQGVFCSDIDFCKVQSHFGEAGESLARWTVSLFKVFQKLQPGSLKPNLAINWSVWFRLCSRTAHTLLMLRECSSSDCRWLAVAFGYIALVLLSPWVCSWSRCSVADPSKVAHMPFAFSSCLHESASPPNSVKAAGYT